MTLDEVTKRMAVQPEMRKENVSQRKIEWENLKDSE